MLVDLAEDAGEVPGAEVFAGGFLGLGALEETPAVLLEVVPVGLREEGVESGVEFTGDRD